MTDLIKISKKEILALFSQSEIHGNIGMRHNMSGSSAESFSASLFILSANSATGMILHMTIKIPPQHSYPAGRNSYQIRDFINRVVLAVVSLRLFCFVFSLSMKKKVNELSY